MAEKLPRLQAGESVTPELFNALIDQVNALSGLTGGGGDARTSEAGTQVASSAAPVFELVELDEDLPPRQVDRRARLLEFDDQAGPDDDKWIDSDQDDETLTDVQDSLYLAGERRLCFLNPSAGRLTPVDGFQWHIGKLDAPLPHGGSIAMSVWQQDPETGQFSDSGQNLTVYDWLLKPMKQLPAGSRVVAMQLAHCRSWIVVATDTCPEDEGS